MQEGNQTEGVRYTEEAKPWAIVATWDRVRRAMDKALEVENACRGWTLSTMAALGIPAPSGGRWPVIWPLYRMRAARMRLFYDLFDLECNGKLHTRIGRP